VGDIGSPIHRLFAHDLILGGAGKIITTSEPNFWNDAITFNPQLIYLEKGKICAILKGLAQDKFSPQGG